MFNRRKEAVISMPLDVHEHRQQHRMTQLLQLQHLPSELTGPGPSQVKMLSPLQPTLAGQTKPFTDTGSDKQGWAGISGVNLSYHLLLDTSLGLQKCLLQLTEEIL